MDSSILISWKCPFVFLGGSGEYFHCCCILHRNSCKQTVWTAFSRFLGLQCLHITPKGVSGLKMVNKGECCKIIYHTMSLLVSG